MNVPTFPYGLRNNLPAVPKGLARLAPRLAAPVLQSGDTGYPWVDGDVLYAADLNAAIAEAGGGGIDVTDWLPGGQPDGVTDLASYFQQALDAAAGVVVVDGVPDRAGAPGSARLIVPANTNAYIIGHGLLIPSHSHIVIEQGATLKIKDGANCSMLLIVAGASDISIDLYGTLDGNSGNQTFGATTVDLFDFERDGGGTASGGICSLGACSNIQIDGANRQGIITNFWNWPVNIVCATNAEVRGVQMTNSGNSCEFAGLTTRVNVVSGSYNAGSGALSLTTDVAHNIAAGQTFTYAAAATPQAFLQGEFIATSVTATTVNATIPTGQPGGGSWSGTAGTQGRVGTCTRCVNVGFVNCFYRDIRDIPMALYSGCSGYIRDCEGIGGPLIFADASQPASCGDCEISGCWCHDSTGSGPGISSNLPGIYHHNCRIFDNVVANNQRGGIGVGAVDGVEVYNNYIHDNGSRFDVPGYSSQIAVGSTATRADIRDNTIRNPGQGKTATFSTGVISGTYDDTTGAVSLVTASVHGIAAGGSFTATNMFGTGGGDFLGLNGSQIAIAGTSGTTLNYAVAPGSGTINLSHGLISTTTYAVASHITPGTYTSDSSGNVSLSTDVSHGFAPGNLFVLGSVFGPPVPPLGQFTATAGTSGTTLNFVTTPGTSLAITSGRVMPANYGIVIEGADFCRMSGNRISDYQKPTWMTAAIGGPWGQNGVSEGNYFGPRSAVDPDVSTGLAINGYNHDTAFGNIVTNTNIAGMVTFQGSTQASTGAPAYFQPRGLTPGWNYHAGQGEVDFLLGDGGGSTGGFDFLQVAVIKIVAGGTYDPVTGNIVLTTGIAHGIVPGGTFTVSNLTGIDANSGADVAALGGIATATVGTAGTTLTYTVGPARLGLTVTSISGGTVVPTGTGGGLLKTGVGVAGSLLANDGLGNTRLGGALVHGAMQSATMANGDTVVVNPNTSLVLIQNASSIATGGVVLPAPQATSYQLAGSVLEVRFQNAIGALTMTAAAGAGVSGAPTAVLSGGSSFRFVLTEPGNVWLPCISDISGTPPVGGPYLALSGGAVTGPTTFSGTTTLSGTTSATGALNYTATGGTVSRAAQSRAAEWLNIKDFGAVGDGVASDHTAIIAAINAANASSTTKTVFFPPGTYMCNTFIPMQSGITLWATPGTATIKATATNAQTPLLLRAEAGSHNDILIYGLILDGNYAGQTGGGGVLNKHYVNGVAGSARVVWDHCRFQNCVGQGLQMNNGMTYSGVRNCTFDNIGQYWHTTGLFADCHQAISLQDTTLGNSIGNFVENCLFTNIGSDCINIGKETGASIHNNRAFLSNLQYVGTGAGCAMVLDIGSNGTTITGNVAWQASGNSFDLAGCTLISIVGNESYNAGVSGIQIGTGAVYGITTGTLNGVISSNVIVNSGQDLALSGALGGCAGLAFTRGVGTSGPTADIVVTGNTFSDNQVTPTQLYGIAALDVGSGLPTLTGLVIDVSNHMVGNVTAPFGGGLGYSTAEGAIAVNSGGKTTLTALGIAGNITAAGLQVSTTYANDAAAATGGVAVGQFYRNGSVVQIRIV